MNSRPTIGPKRANEIPLAAISNNECVDYLNFTDQRFHFTPTNSNHKEEKSGIPQCLASNYIINSMLTSDLAFAMGLLGVNADLPSPSPLLYVNCLNLDSQSYVNSSNLACCRFLTVMGHVSFSETRAASLLVCAIRNIERPLATRLFFDFFHAFTVCLNID